MTIKYICNAFSLQMVSAERYQLKVRTISADEFNNMKEAIPSAVGHPDTANVLGVNYNRCNISLDLGDGIIVAQLQGGRLPEGATTLPKGFSFKFYLIEVDFLPRMQ